MYLIYFNMRVRRLFTIMVQIAPEISAAFTDRNLGGLSINLKNALDTLTYFKCCAPL